MIRLLYSVILLIAAQAIALAAIDAALAQTSVSLDQPLTTLNACGAGDPAEVQFTIAATGDTFPHENIQYVGETQGYDVLFDHIRPFLQAADLAYTNFDGAMLSSSPTGGYPVFNYNPLLAAALRNAGISLVSTANNHIFDRGPEGLDATLEVLAANGILQHGAVSIAAATQTHLPYLPVVLNRDGVSIRIGFISATWGTNGIPDPYGQVNLLWQSDSYGSQGDVRQSILDAIAQARRETDLVLVAAHWGQEYQFYPQEYQVEGARAMVAAGADIILGAQPHTLQPVDLIESGGRRGFVAYSLANFLASQGAYQDQLFTATSVILYVGIARAADGTVRVTGYRYLPTVHVDGDTRPAPIPAQGYEPVIAHVRAMMRDPGGARQVAPDMPVTPITICPPLAFGERPDITLTGDFAEQFRTLGGSSPRAPEDAIRVYGYPRGAPRRELAGDCRGETDVLYTDAQRLELHPESPWPFRVVGTQLGVLAYERRYGPARRQMDLTAGAFADETIRAFFERYGGVAVLGYPISGMIPERGADGIERQVQYFERARLELDSAAPDGIHVAALASENTFAGQPCAPVAPTAIPGQKPPQPIPTPIPTTVAASITPLPTIANRSPVPTAIIAGVAPPPANEDRPGEPDLTAPAKTPQQQDNNLRAWSWLILASIVPLSYAAWREWKRTR